MLYHLFKLFENYDFPGHNLMNFLSVRALLANVLAMVVSFVLGKKIIELLRKAQIGETVRDLGLQGQMEKKGTPTMGGIIIIASLLASVLLVCDLSSIYTQLLVLTTVGCGTIGFADDFIKVFKHDKNGLSEKAKLAAQIALGLIIALIICLSDNIFSDKLITTIPFVKANEFDYSWLSPFHGQAGVYFTWAVYVAVIVLVIAACTNGANLTDGIDGLAAGSSAIIGIVIGILAWLGGNSVQSDYLNIMYIPGSGEVAVFMSAFVGALVGFLWYNTYPAEIFMGDTGSLTIGGIIGVGAILIHKELLLPVICGIFLIETLSVILQRSHYKRTRRKYGEPQRLFLMAPIHHHFQKKGIPEPKIVVRFWVVGIIMAVSALGMLKLR